MALEWAREVDPVGEVGGSAAKISDRLAGKGGTGQEGLDSGYSS